MSDTQPAASSFPSRLLAPGVPELAFATAIIGIMLIATLRGQRQATRRPRQRDPLRRPP